MMDVDVVGVATGSYQERSGTGGATIMMMLGNFEFSINTTAYHQLTREARWRWSEQERFGKQDLLQYTGKTSRSVKIEGEAHSQLRNGLASIDVLYDLADRAEPQQLVSSAGDVLGWWVVTDFSDVTPAFLPGGVPRKKTWTLTIKHYADDLSDP